MFELVGWQTMLNLSPFVFYSLLFSSPLSLYFFFLQDKVQQDNIKFWSTFNPKGVLAANRFAEHSKEHHTNTGTPFLLLWVSRNQQSSGRFLNLSEDHLLNEVEIHRKTVALSGW